VPVLRGQPIMTHSPGPGSAVIHLGTIELLTAVAFDIGVFLLVFGFAVGAIDLIAQAHDEETDQLPDRVTDQRINER
jgi:multicomponent Na+:H+ antiporter subunit B